MGLADRANDIVPCFYFYVKLKDCTKADVLSDKIFGQRLDKKEVNSEDSIIWIDVASELRTLREVGLIESARHDDIKHSNAKGALEKSVIWHNWSKLTGCSQAGLWLLNKYYLVRERHGVKRAVN